MKKDNKSKRVCSECGRVFKNKRGRKIHYGLEHEGDAHSERMKKNNPMFEEGIREKNSKALQEKIRKEGFWGTSPDLSEYQKSGTMSEEARRKISEANSGEGNGNFGKTGEDNPFGGESHDLETRLRMSRNSPSGENHPNWRGGSWKYGENNERFTGEWNIIRDQVLKRDDYRCQKCGSHRKKLDRDLNIHHIRPYRLFDDKSKADRLDNLVSLCTSCHHYIEKNEMEGEFLDLT